MAEAGKGPGTGRYAAYDRDLLRFVGGVHESSEEASKAGKAAGAKRIQVREV